jgi:predicted RNA-binding Zn-ribbon protein involved in translation (DUF1610 family)
MAERRRFFCPACDFEIMAWSDGNPYYRDEKGEKQYAYHPDHEALERCIGNDVPHICLACAHRFRVDSNAPRTTCPACDGDAITPAFRLDGHSCPACHNASIRTDPDIAGIS